MVLIIYAVRTEFSQADEVSSCEATNIYSKVHSAVQIFDLENGVWFLILQIFQQLSAHAVKAAVR